MEAEVVNIGHCGECKTEGWMGNDIFPPCDDSYCTGPYRVDGTYSFNEYTLDILCIMALADAFGFEYGEFV